MVEILASPAPLSRSGTPGRLEAIQAGALFVSALQPSEAPSPDQVRRVVRATLRRLGVRGCAKQMAVEFGDHPDTAVARMSWVLAMIRAVYPEPAITPSSPGLPSFAS